MRRYIFTELERRLLQSWLAGEVSAENAGTLDVTLDRIRMYKQKLLADFRLFIQALRRLNLERRFEK